MGIAAADPVMTCHGRRRCSRRVTTDTIHFRHNITITNSNPRGIILLVTNITIIHLCTHKRSQQITLSLYSINPMWASCHPNDTQV